LTGYNLYIFQISMYTLVSAIACVEEKKFDYFFLLHIITITYFKCQLNRIAFWQKKKKIL